MELAYETIELRRLCLSRIVAEKKLGKAGAKFFLARLADLRAIDCIGELLVGQQTFEGKGPRQTAILSFGNGLKIVLLANQARLTVSEEDLDWDRVRRVKIVDVEFEDD